MSPFRPHRADHVTGALASDASSVRGVAACDGATAVERAAATAQAGDTMLTVIRFMGASPSPLESHGTLTCDFEGKHSAAAMGRECRGSIKPGAASQAPSGLGERAEPGGKVGCQRAALHPPAPAALDARC